MGLFDRPVPEPNVKEDTHVAFPDDEEETYTVEYRYVFDKSSSYPHRFLYTVNNSRGETVVEGKSMEQSKEKALDQAKYSARLGLDDYIKTIAVPDVFTEEIKPSKSRK